MPKRVQVKRNSKVKTTKTKQKADARPRPNDAGPRRKKFRKENEEISSDSDLEFDEKQSKKTEGYSDDEEQETAQEKRLKLAKQYLLEIEEQEKSKSESKEIDRDIISKRLRHEVLEKAGQLQKQVADSYDYPNIHDIKTYRGHKLPVTCLVISNDEKHVFSASKDSSLIKWKLNDGSKIKVIKGQKKGADNKEVGHSAHVNCLAVSSDNRFLVSGDDDRNIHVWNAELMTHLKTFTSHRDGITALAFRRNTRQLFSTSKDRSVKIWNIDEMAYVETLFGHQDTITSIDSLLRDRAITSGGRDQTVRLWKVTEESQLVFQGNSSSIDCVRLINEQHFVSGADDGSLSLWGLHKKKPLYIQKQAHGVNENDEARWITAIAVFPNTDLIASGSHDGQIRLWKCSDGFKSLSLKFSVPVEGFVNALEFTQSGRHLVAGVGQEHKSGRWWRIKEAKNSVVIIPLKLS